MNRVGDADGREVCSVRYARVPSGVLIVVGFHIDHDPAPFDYWTDLASIKEELKTRAVDFGGVNAITSLKCGRIIHMSGRLMVVLVRAAC